MTEKRKQDFVNGKMEVKKIMMKSSLAVIVSLIVMNVFVVLTMLVSVVADAIKNSSSVNEASLFIDRVVALDEAQFGQRYGSSGIGYLISIVVVVFLFCLIFRKNVSLRGIFVENEKMTAGIFVACFLIFYAIQLPFEVIDFSLEKLLNLFGLTFQLGQEMASGEVTSVSLGIYACLGGPIAEELLYRGFIMNSLKKYGVNFAIVISAIFFGLMHTNLTQSVFAIFAGIVLGYVAMRYSIKWSIALHIINNTLCAGMTYLEKSFFPNQELLLTFLVEFVFFVASLFILTKVRDKIRTFVKTNKTEGSIYKWAFSSKLFILWIIGCVISAFGVIQVLA